MDSKSIFTELWDSYKRIILHNIVTSFGLDFIVKDQIGGDVDTIHSVRDTERYKNVLNEKEYENREAYNSTAYHHNEVYDSMIREVRNSHDFFDDAYVPGNRIFYGKASGIGTDHRANHVYYLKWIMSKCTPIRKCLDVEDHIYIELKIYTDLGEKIVEVPVNNFYSSGMNQLIKYDIHVLNSSKEILQIMFMKMFSNMPVEDGTRKIGVTFNNVTGNVDFNAYKIIICTE